MGSDDRGGGGDVGTRTMDGVSVRHGTESEDFLAPEPGSGKHIASIIHLTDLHLLLSEDFGATPLGVPGWQVALIESVLRHAEGLTHAFTEESLAEGLAVADLASLDWLRTAFSTSLALEREVGGSGMPIAIVHTGDVEAHGAVNNPDYRGFRYLDEHLASLLDPDDAYLKWIDVYGNHDVWPRTWPLEIRQLRPGSERMHNFLPRFKCNWPAQIDVPSGEGPALNIYPLNSVLDDAIRGGILAKGELGFHVRSLGTGSQSLQLLRRLIGETPHSAVHIAISHHPIAPFDDTESPSVSNGPQFGAEITGLHLALAGHRHQIDPDHAAMHHASEQQRSCLPYGCGQLCAASPTQAPPKRRPSPTRGPIERSFSVYRLFLDERGEYLSVDRLRYINGIASGNRVKREPEIISGIPFDQKT